MKKTVISILQDLSSNNDCITYKSWSFYAHAIYDRYVIKQNRTNGIVCSLLIDAKANNNLSLLRNGLAKSGAKSAPTPNINEYSCNIGRDPRHRATSQTYAPVKIAT